MITFYDGPNLSGRSAELRRFAWDTPSRGVGIYVQQLLAPNLSGLATTVKGEAFLHGISAGQPWAGELADAASGLVSALPPDQPLSSLSGGEQAKLIMACALASRPRRLAIDGLLEHLDGRSRAAFVRMCGQSGLREVEFHIVDNYGDPISTSAEAERRFGRVPDAPDLNAMLHKTVEELGRSRLRAPTIALEAISFRYRGNKGIFDDTSFSFEPGVPYILKAPNGSGKSTLASLLAGSVKPSGGAILVDGRLHAPHKSARNLIFCSFQNPFEQILGRSVSEYLRLLSAAAAARATFLEGGLNLDAESLIAGFGLSSFASTEPFDLPRFVAKRLGVGAAILSRSPWLFFDEPSIGSDADGRRALFQLFRTLANIGFGLILVSHGTEFDGLPGARPITIAAGKIVAGADDGRD